MNLNDDPTKVSPLFKSKDGLRKWIEKRYGVIVLRDGPNWAGWQTFILNNERIIYIEDSGSYANRKWQVYSEPQPFSAFLTWVGEAQVQHNMHYLNPRKDDYPSE